MPEVWVCALSNTGSGLSRGGEYMGEKSAGCRVYSAALPAPWHGPAVSYGISAQSVLLCTRLRYSQLFVNGIPNFPVTLGVIG